jgi:macrolide-specific efflux system membrane fusion protein
MRSSLATARPGPAGLPAALLGTWRGRAALLVLVALTAGGIVRAGSSAGPTYRTQPVARGTVTQTVIVFGAIDTSAALKLNFKASGKVAKVSATVGETVPAGRTLAQLDTADLQIALATAKAGLANAQARYDQTLAGASAEDIALARNAVDAAQRLADQTQTAAQGDVSAAQQALDNAKSALDRARQSAAADVETARVALERVRTNYTSSRATFGATVARIKADVAAYLAAISDAKAQVNIALSAAGDPGLSADVQPTLNSAITSLITAETSAFAPVQDALRDLLVSAGRVTAAADAFDSAVASGGDITSAVTQFQAAQTRYGIDATRLSTALDGPAGLVASASAAVVSANNALNTFYRAGNPRYDDARTALAVVTPILSSDTQLAAALKTEIAQAGGALQVVGDAIGGSYASALQAAASAKARADASVAAAESAVSAAQKALASAQDRAATQVSSQQSALRNAQLTLEKTSASARATDIAAAYANVLAQQAGVDKATADLANAALVAPSAGTITAVNGREGEFVTGGNALTAFIVFQPSSAVALRGSVGEADVAKLKVGQEATVAVEAAGSTKALRGHVSTVDPSATVQQGVAAYSVEVTVDEAAVRAAPGMTGTASVIVARKADVLTVPAAAVHERGGKRAVAVWAGGTATETEVTVGIADDSAVEVTSGLREGQDVVVSEGATAPGSAQVTASAPFSYPTMADPSLERIAVIVQVTNRSQDDLVMSLTDFIARDTQHRLYPADPQATAADARVVRAVAALRGMNGVRPLQPLTLRKDDVLVGFVVFSVPAGTRPSQLVYRQTDADVVVDLTVR